MPYFDDLHYQENMPREKKTLLVQMRIHFTEMIFRAVGQDFLRSFRKDKNHFWQR